MVVQVEKRLVWHPRRENKFAVGGGTQITLYEWVPQSSEIKQVTSQLDLANMKCFAWSPDPLLDDLVAVGLSTGRVELMRLESPKRARNDILTAGPTVALPTRSPRSCNALAFSTVDPNYLAVGLDKVRGDSSLVIWDISTAIPMLSLKQSPSHHHHHHHTRSTSPMLPRGDVGPRTDARIVQLHAAADTVTSVTFLPQSMSSLLAGISHRWLRLFDLRSPATNPVTVASKAHGIATDPFDAHRVACFGDNVVTVWDTRRFTQPLLTFTEKDAGADGARLRQNAVLTTVEFSSTRRGMLATLEREASHVRFWDLQQAHIAEGTPEGSRSRSRDSSHSGKGTRLSWANPSSMLPWSASNAVHSTTSTTPGESSPYHLVLADTRKTKNFSRILSSFALVPSADPHPLTSNIMVVNREGDLELYSVHDTPKHSPWSARGDLALGIGCSYRIFPGFREHSPPPEPWDILMQPSASVSHPHSLEDQSSPSRGRSTTPPPAFGRGDADGFPALNSPPGRPQANLAATRPGREREREHDRTFSPAVLRHSHFEHTTMRKGEHGRAHVASGTPRAYTLPLNGGSAKVKHAHSRAREAPAGRGRAETAIQHLVEEDISMVMRKRVIQGYGLVNSLHNSIVAKETSPEDPALSETWLWIHHAQRLLSTPTPILESYDFSYQGLFGIWEGFRPFLPHIAPPPTPRMPQRSTLFDLSSPLISGLTLESRGSRSNSKHGGRRRSRPPTTQRPEEFLTAIAVLNGRSAREQPPWRPSVATTRLAQRQFALQLCGWSLAEDDLAVAIKRWERENSHSQAACWLIFTDQHKQAVELLMRSKDESHHMMSGMIAALTPTSSGNSAKNPDLVAHCERLIVRLQDPYLRVMLTYLTVKDWSEVLQEESLPLRERLAIAFQFLDDKDVSSYLRRITDRCCHDGDIEGIIVTGLTPAGMDILQTYIDVTGDIQTAAILSSLSPPRAHDARVKRWLDTYRNVLDGWRLFHHRCQFDIDRGHILQAAIQNGEVKPFEWAPRQILIRCNYCNKTMDPPFSEANNPRATLCPHCGRPLPRCSICLMTLNLAQDAARSSQPAPGDTIDEALVFCQTCRHGGHASHILRWFFGEDSSRCHGTCPVAGCDCRCADEF